jgi:hypothetical protein
MRRFVIFLTVGFVLGAWGIALGCPASGIEYFCPQYPPEGPGIVIDADHSDWAGYPAETTITVDMLYVHAGDDMDLDPLDFDATIKWAWHDADNALYAATEQFDDIYNAIPEVGYTETYQYDDMEMTTDADNSCGRYQYGDLPEDEWGMGGQQWGFGPSPEPYHLVYRISGADWMTLPPYSDYFAIVTEEATGTRIFHELYMVMWDFLSPTGPDESIPHDLEEGDTIGATFYFDDYDEDPSRLGGQWKTHERPDAPHLADAVPDVHLIGSQAWDTSQLVAVQPASWGAVKATFAR